MLGGILAKMGPQDTTPVSNIMLLKKFVCKIIVFCHLTFINPYPPGNFAKKCLLMVDLFSDN